MSNEQKPGDPADKGADQFVSHRAGYGDDKLARLVDYLRRQPRATLASGEGAVLLAEIDRLRDDLHTQDGWVQWANGEMERLRNQLYLADQSARSSSAEAARLRAENAALTAAVERVRALHQEGFTRGCCRTCKGRDDIHVPLPCPTLRALEVGRE